MPKITQQYVQAPPFCLQVELCEGCNLRCSFCGLNGIRGKANDLKFMTLDLAKVLIEQIKESKWNSRIEFAMHGEPSLHPDLVKIVSLFRKGLPKKTHLMMTSNGGGFLRSPTELIDGVLINLNVLALDAYENVNIVPKILEKYTGVFKPKHYPKDKQANPHQRRAEGEHDLVIVQDISEATKGTHSSLNNHCGCGAPLNDSAQGKRCAKPFREMSIRWDGSIALCCNDWTGVYKCGNIQYKSIVDIWQGPEFQAARRKLYHGLRDFGACKGCDALSYRPGLLPDQRGNDSLPLPSPRDEAVIAKAVAGKTYTLPVLRDWQKV